MATKIAKAESQPAMSPKKRAIAIGLLLRGLVPHELQPTWARAVLEDYVQQCARGRLHRSLIGYVALCLHSYLTGQAKTLDAAFHIKRRRGAPHLKQDKQVEIALSVLRRRIAGASFEVAVATVSDELKRHRVKGASEERVRKHWIRQRIDALQALTPSERKKHANRLKKIYADLPWLLDARLLPEVKKDSQ